MGADLGGGRGGPIASINVTPFVDVVLVLLVIFMVTAPLIMKDTIGLKLPKAATTDGKAPQTLGVAVTKTGQVLVNGEPATEASVAEAVRRALASDPNAQAILAADVEAVHGDVVKAIDWLKTAGMNRFALQVDRH